MERNIPSIRKTLFKSQVKVTIDDSKGPFLNLLHTYLVLVVNGQINGEYLKGDRMYGLYISRDFTGLKKLLTLLTAFIL